MQANPDAEVPLDEWNEFMDRLPDQVTKMDLPDGTVRVLQRRADPRVGPNDPCPCGCGRKSKRCRG